MTNDPKVVKTVNTTTVYTNLVPWDIYLAISQTLDNLVEVRPGKWYVIIKKSTWEAKP